MSGGIGAVRGDADRFRPECGVPADELEEEVGMSRSLHILLCQSSDRPIDLRGDWHDFEIAASRRRPMGKPPAGRPERQDIQHRRAEDQDRGPDFESAFA